MNSQVCSVFLRAGHCQWLNFNLRPRNVECSAVYLQCNRVYSHCANVQSAKVAAAMQSHVRSRCPRNIATSYFLLLLILVAMMVKMMVTKVIALLKSLSINRMSSPVCLINVPLNEGPVWESRTHKDLHKMYATSIHIYNKCLLMTTFNLILNPIAPLPYI